ncbi:MAG: hypothetical protein HKM28_06295 [Flavobacteriaceae bacterium]|nr:hypothetical protein [Flavobacteriaceae bacterium]
MEAATVEAVAKKLNTQLQGVDLSDPAILVAYKGAIMTMMAKYTRNKSEKKDFFKEGVSLLEAAVESDPNNIEIRTIRLSIQENAPKFLRYHKNISEDKQYILEHYKEVRNAELKIFVKKFVQQSSEFEDQEKAAF